VKSMMFVALLFFQATGFSATIYVPDDYLLIQDAINASTDGDVIIVRPGVYPENIYFNGRGITLKSEQGPGLTTINGNHQDCVVRFQSSEGPESILDGFLITNGRADEGGGIFCLFSDPVIKNNIISGNEAFSGGGGGIYCMVSSPVITGNIISENIANSSGGAISCTEYSDPEITKNTIKENSSGHSGGAIFCLFNSNPLIQNNLIYNNFCLYQGGGIHCQYTSNPVVSNCTLCKNAAIQGGGMACDSSSPLITNSIFWNNSAFTGDEIFVGSGNPLVEYSDIQGGFAGFRIIDQQPHFKNIQQDNYCLARHSPCINRGNNSSAPGEDIEEDPRPCMGTVDIGADEFHGPHTLEADGFEVSESGGKVKFSLDCSPGWSQRTYLILGSATGTTPGYVLPGSAVILPINYDDFTDVVFSLLNTPVFTDFLGNLDLNGDASAAFDSFGPMPGLIGVTFSFSYLLGNPFDFSSNPIDVLVVP